MTESTVINPQSIENLRSLNPGDDDEFLREIVALFLDDTPLRIAELDQSLAMGDVPKFTRAAHSIKGSASNLGAECLHAAAEKLENLVASQGLANVTPLIADVKAEFERAHAALTALVAR